MSIVLNARENMIDFYIRRLSLSKHPIRWNQHACQKGKSTETVLCQDVNCHSSGPKSPIIPLRPARGWQVKTMGFSKKSHSTVLRTRSC